MCIFLVPVEARRGPKILPGTELQMVVVLELKRSAFHLWAIFPAPELSVFDELYELVSKPCRVSGFRQI